MKFKMLRSVFLLSSLVCLNQKAQSQSPEPQANPPAHAPLPLDLQKLKDAIGKAAPLPDEPKESEISPQALMQKIGQLSAANASLQLVIDKLQEDLKKEKDYAAELRKRLTGSPAASGQPAAGAK